jgi:hypothetical protein
MDVQRVERIADFVRDAGRQQRQCLDAFAFDGLKRFCRASVASCKISATPELPAASPSSGAA